MPNNVCKKDVVILSTHIVNDFVIKKYRKLCVELPNIRTTIVSNIL